MRFPDASMPSSKARPSGLNCECMRGMAIAAGHALI
jgi:hypothetical protein